MQLTSYTDYALRVLIYLGLKKNGELSTINEISQSFQISKNHLVKVVHHLSQLGLIESFQGAKGGIRLIRDPENINLAEVIKSLEPHFELVECFSPEGKCVIKGACRLEHILHKARAQFFSVLAAYSLADLSKNPLELKKRLF